MAAATTKRAATKATASTKTTRTKSTAVDVTSPEFLAAVKAATEAVLASSQSTPATVADVDVDPVSLLVHGRGLKFAKGGRSYLTLDAMTAGARVLKTGTPEIVGAGGEKSEERRSVTHLVLWRTEAGNVGIHPLFTA